jgi:hypothetical protein
MSPATLPSRLSLPLTPLESYLLADDRADYPMTFWLQSFLSGAVDKPAMLEAVDEAVERHPMLRAIIVRDGKRLAWSFNERRPISHSWEMAGVPIRCDAGERIDLNRESGLRVWTREHPDGIESTFQVHHSCCDGLGTLQFLGDLLLQYAYLRGANVVPPRPPDYGRLASRDDLSAVRPYARHKLRLAMHGIGRVVRHFIWQRPTPLYAPPPTASGESIIILPGIVWHSFDAAFHRHLRRVARRHRVSLNTLFLGCLFQTMCEWNAPHDPRFQRRWLRILMPSELRGLAEADLSACNAVSYFFLNRQPRACTDSVKLLQGIQEETTVHHRLQVAASFFASIRLMTRFAAIRPILYSGPCLATAVLTYLGDLSSRFIGELVREDGRIVSGGMVLQRACGAPPLRPGTIAAFELFAYAGELTVCLRANPHCFAPEDSTRLLGLFVKKLQQFT